MSKERDIQILEYKIADIDTKIPIYLEQQITQNKIDRLLTLRAKYQMQLDALNA